jgi:hypothetical protein
MKIIKFKSQGCEGKSIKYKFINHIGVEVFKALPYYNYTLRQVNANIAYLNKLQYEKHESLKMVYLVDDTTNIIRIYYRKGNKFIN